MIPLVPLRLVLTALFTLPSGSPGVQDLPTAWILVDGEPLQTRVADYCTGGPSALRSGKRCSRSSTEPAW